MAEKFIKQNHGISNQCVFGLNDDKGFYSIVQFGPFRTIEEANKMSEYMTFAVKDTLAKEIGHEPIATKIVRH